MRSVAQRVGVTILCDNHVAGADVLAEHGLGMHIEVDGRCFLFDTGASGVLVRNAARLGIDLAPANQIMLSHGHYDHTGGLVALLSGCPGREIVGHPEVLAPKFSRQRARPARSIGSPASRRELRALGATFGFSAAPQELAPGVMTTGVIPRTTDFEKLPHHFAVKRRGRLSRDVFEDEQALVIRTRRGVVVIVGCAHRGLVNTLRHAMILAGDDRIRALVGGTHLAGAGPRQLEATIRELRALKVRRLVACHCTGFAASVRLKEALDEAFEPGGVGLKLEF